MTRTKRKIDRFELPEVLHALLEACGWSKRAATEPGRSMWVVPRDGLTGMRSGLPITPRAPGHADRVARMVPPAARELAAGRGRHAEELDAEALGLERRAREVRAEAEAVRARASAIDTELAALPEGWRP